ncbi:MAG: toprim domain-containing protein [Candidatus Bathyarchaeota archaeon]|nr:toprim domain-containing protein [Candidatus Bathyarchaeota archaeon]
MRSRTSRKQAIEDLKNLLNTISPIVDVVIVEGSRDIVALRRLGYKGEIVACSQIGVNDYDLMSMISERYHRVLILTDYDQEGLVLNNRFSSILEHEGVIVEKGLRKEVGRLTAALRVYAIEALDNMMDNLDTLF